MNAHFSNACNSVAFTWGTQRLYHAAQFGEQFAFMGLRPSPQRYRQDQLAGTKQELGQMLASGPAGAYGAGEALADYQRIRPRANLEAQRNQEEASAFRRNAAVDAPGAVQLPGGEMGPHGPRPNLQEPFEGTETGPEIWTHRDKHRSDLLDRLRLAGYGGPELEADLDALLDKHDRLVDSNQLNPHSPYGADAESTAKYIPPRR